MAAAANFVMNGMMTWLTVENMVIIGHKQDSHQYITHLL